MSQLLMYMDTVSPDKSCVSCLETVSFCLHLHSSAGEIREEMPDKKVTLVTSKELMPSANPIFPDKFRARLRAKLEAIDVTVHTDGGRLTFDREDVNDCGFIVGRRTYSWNGGEMEADLCVIATGWRYTPPLYKDSGLDGWLDEKGFLAVGRLCLLSLLFRFVLSPYLSAFLMETPSRERER